MSENLDRLPEDPELALYLLKQQGVDPRTWKPEEVEMLSLALQELRTGGDSTILKQMEAIDFYRKPPCIEEFLESPEYMGDVCTADPITNNPGIFPKWREVLYRDFDESSITNQVIFTGGIGLGKSLVKGTLVQTLTGSKPIEQIKIGETIYTETGLHRVQDWIDEGRIKTTTLTTKHGHTLTGGYFKHRVRVINPSTFEIEWKLMRELETDDIVVFKPNTVPSSFEQNKHAELIGWTAGDGNKNPSNLRLSVNEALETDYVRSLVQDTSPSEYSESVSKGTFYTYSNGGNTPKECLDLCKAYSHEREIPYSILASKENLRAFLKGYFSADGSASNGILEVTTTSKVLAEQVRVGLISLGIYCGISSKIPVLNGEPKRRAYTIRVIGTKSKQKFSDEIGLIPYKQEKLSEQLSRNLNDDHWFSFPVSEGGLARLRDLQPTYNAKKPHPEGLTKEHTPKGLLKRLRTQKCTLSLLQQVLDAGGTLPKSLQQLAEGELMFDTVEKVCHGREHCFDISVDSDPTYISNGIISHNTYCGCLAILYKLAFALCLRNPLLYYGLSKATQLVCSFFSVTQKQVQGGAFRDAVSLMSQSPFFVERIPDNLNNRRFANRRIELQNNIIIEAGSQMHEALGRNTLYSLVDEINFRLEKEAADAAESLINSITRRQKSRFGNQHSGLLVVISSAKEENDFLTGHIKKCRDKEEVAIYDFPWWDVAGPIKMKPPYSGEKFYVDIGDQTTPSKILDEADDINAIPDHRLLEVPVEHRSEFEEDLDGAIRDIGGKTTGRQSKFFGNIIPIINSLRDDIQSPLNGGMEVIKNSVTSEHALKECFNEKVLCQIRGGTIMPRRHSTAPRFIHIDMSSGAQDALGFGMVHPIGLAKVTEYDRLAGREMELQKPIFELDMAFRILREDPNEPIDFGRLRQFIMWLYRDCGFEIAKVTADLLNMSGDTLALLRREGLDAEYLSMDEKITLKGNKKHGPAGGYHSFRQAFSERRIHTYPCNWLFQELINLEVINDKVDHPKKWGNYWCTPDGDRFNPGTEVASKDVADAVGGAIYSAERYEEHFTNLAPEHVNQVLAEVASEPIMQEGHPADIMVM